MTSGERLQSAHQDYQAGNLDAAARTCAEVLKSEPKNAKALQLAAMIAKKQGAWAHAVDYINAAIALAPDDAECFNTHGNIMADVGRTLEAIQSYRKSLSLVPNYLSAALNYGQLLLNIKDPGDAAGIFRNTLEYHPGHPQLMRGLLYALKDAQQHKQALDLLGRIPRSPDLALAAGQLFTANNQIGQAEKAFRSAMTFPPTAAQAFRNLVQLAWMDKGPDAAVSVIEDAVKSHPEAAVFYMTGADLFREMGSLEAAYNLLDQCEAKFGQQADINFLRCTSKIDAGEGEAAYDYAEAALGQRPGDIMIMNGLVRSALMTEKYDIALQAAKAVQQRLPNDQFWIAMEATALRGLGQDYRHLCDMENFIRIYDLEAPPRYRDMAEFNKEMKAVLGKRHDTRHHPLSQSLRQGTQTSRDLRFAAEHVIQDFFKMLERPIKDYMSKIGNADGHPLTRRNSGDYRLTGAWSVRLQGQGYHVNHVHPEGWISSSYYVDVPEEVADDEQKPGWIKFGEPPFKVPGQPPERFIQPQAGRLVLFPSYMWHGTVPIKDGSTRMTLPFDVVPA